MNLLQVNWKLTLVKKGTSSEFSTASVASNVNPTQSSFFLSPENSSEAATLCLLLGLWLMCHMCAHFHLLPWQSLCKSGGIVKLNPLPKKIMWVDQDKLSLFHSTGWILFIYPGDLMENKQISYFCSAMCKAWVKIWTPAGETQD